MGGCRMDGPDTPYVQSPEEMAGRFQSELMTALPGWKAGLRVDPDRLIEIEQQVHAAFARGADLLIVGLIAMVMKTPEFTEGGERIRQNATVPLGRGRERQIQRSEERRVGKECRL